MFNKAFWITWIVCTLMLSAVLGPIAILAALLPALTAGSLTRAEGNVGSAGTLTANREEPLKPTVAAKNIALDVESQRLWLRDHRGQTHIVHRTEIMNWEHTWRSITNAFGAEFRRDNVIEIGLRRIDTPSVRVRFDSYSHAFASSKNYDEAAAWYQRLNAFVKK